MRTRSNAAFRLLTVVTVIALVGGCGSGAVPTQGSTAPAPSGSPAVPTATGPGPTPVATPGVVATGNVAYESTNTILIPGTLDVFAPTEPGPWPVVVLFHGTPGGDPKQDRAYLATHARLLARLGFVVFNASWGQMPGGLVNPPTYDWLQANNAQGACAVAFARAHASEYGGDPASMIVFGHSGGASIGAMVAFARPAPSAGCLGGATLGTIDALVTWEGSWVLSANYPDWNSALAADPRVLGVTMPWPYLAEHKDLRVAMLVSAKPGSRMDREVGDPWAKGSWLGVRDPSGDLRRQLEANGAFADGTLDFTEVQQLLFSVLTAQGNDVSLDVMPDSVHDQITGGGWEVFLAAFQKAAGRA